MTFIYLIVQASIQNHINLWNYYSFGEERTPTSSVTQDVELGVTFREFGHEFHKRLLFWPSRYFFNTAAVAQKQNSTPCTALLVPRSRRLKYDLLLTFHACPMVAEVTVKILDDGLMAEGG